MMTLRTYCAGAALLWSLAAQAATLQGEAFYRERMALPPQAVFEAVLIDSARADAAAETLGRARLDPAGQTPFRFSIDYDEGKLRPGGRYAVRAAVTLDGRLLFTTDRAAPAFGAGPLKLLMVRAGGGASTLRNTTWKLTQLGDAPVKVAEGQREPYLTLEMNKDHVSGSGGCNRFAGGFTLKRRSLSFGHVAATMMMCPQGMEQEQAFFAALAKTARYSIDGDRLELLDKSGAVLMRLNAVAPR
jgi:putative lipoprotein